MQRIAMEQIIKQASTIKTNLTGLKEDLQFIKKNYKFTLINRLTSENNDLLAQVKEAVRKLNKLESNTEQISSESQVHVISDPSKNLSTETVPTKQEITTKKEKKQSAKQSSGQDELPIDIGRLDLRVGQIMQIDKHPDADSLYISKVNCGDPQLRTVCSGLVKFIPINELENKKVVVLCNLKPVKMRGVTSEAMIMCASTPNVVEVLNPPAETTPGDIITCEGYIRQPDPQLNPKKKIFESVAVDLKTNESFQACYKTSTLIVPDKGPITVASLKNANIK